MITPEGFATVTPYLCLDNAPGFIHFMRTAFGATELGRALREDGSIQHAQLRVGNTTLMLSEATAQYPAQAGNYYLFVDDVHAAMARAIAAGATLEMAVAEMPYGDRQGGVNDGFGNRWWVSQRLAKGAYF